MATWQRVVTSNNSGEAGASDYITEDTTGSAATIVDVLGTGQGGTGLTGPASGVLMYGALAENPTDWSTVGSTTENDVLVYDGTDFKFQQMAWTAPDGVEYMQTNTDASFQTLTVTGSLEVSEGVVWSGEQLTTSANIISLNADNTAVANGDQLGLKVELGAVGEYASLVWDVTSSKWIMDNDPTGAGAATAEVAVLQVANYSGAGPTGAGVNGVGTIAVDTNNSKIYIQTEA